MIMALTATATRTTQKVVKKCLAIKESKTCVISVTPNKPNTCGERERGHVRYIIVLPITEQLKAGGTSSNRIVIYCHNHKDVAEFYEPFQSMLGPSFTDPSDFLDLAKYQLVDMYTSVTAKSVKELIVKSFCNPLGRLRVVICTIAFGMGLDCPNVCQIIHWGPAEDLEGYVQQTGRSGRDGQLCLASLFWKKGDQQHTAKQMMEYCRSHTCRSQELFKD